MHSRFGGLWIDRSDVNEVLAAKISSGLISDSIGKLIGSFVKDGYIVLQKAVPKEVTKKIRDELDYFWRHPSKGSLIENWSDGVMRVVSPDVALRAGCTKLFDFHAFSKTARNAIAAPIAVEFLSAIFGETPKAFQSLTFWNGSQQPIHKDTAYVQIHKNPMQLAASWLALEDIHPGTGELEYFVGSHRSPDFLFGGKHKWLAEAPQDHDAFLASLHEDSRQYGQPKSSFLACEGDILIWHADLAHGGSKITDPRTRQSLVTHFTPESFNPPYAVDRHVNPVKENDCLFIAQHSTVLSLDFQ